jgi:hypothetical protein
VRSRGETPDYETAQGRVSLSGEGGRRGVLHMIFSKDICPSPEEKRDHLHATILTSAVQRSPSVLKMVIQTNATLIAEMVD